MSFDEKAELEKRRARIDHSMPPLHIVTRELGPHQAKVYNLQDESLLVECTCGAWWTHRANVREEILVETFNNHICYFDRVTQVL